MNYQEIIKEQLGQYIEDDTKAAITDNLSEMSKGLTDELTLDHIIDNTINGQSIFEDTNLIENIKDLILYETTSAISFALQILICCIFCALICALSGEKAYTKVEEVGRYICLLIVSGLIITNYTQMYNYCLETISSLTSVMNIIIPIIIAVLIASGRVVSGGILSPFILGSIDIFANLLTYVVFPLMLGSIILTIFNSLTEKDYVNQLAKLASKAALFLTGLATTILTLILTVQGLLSDTSDGLLLNTAKYSLSSFIPIVGGFTSDTLEMFIRCMSTIKTVFGAFSIISIVLVFLIPVIKTFVIGVIYKIVSVIIEPVSDGKVTGAISSAGTNLFFLTGIMIFIQLLFIIFISVIIGIGE